MKLAELEGRLIAVDIDGTKSAIWKDGEWVEGSDVLAAKAWTDGVFLTPKRAEKLFPGIDLDALPDL